MMMMMMMSNLISKKYNATTPHDGTAAHTGFWNPDDC